MPVRRDPRTKRWFFRAVVKLPDGTRRRIFGTPGVPGPYQDLAPNKDGAREAEDRAKAAALTGAALQPAPAKEVPTIEKYAETFLDSYAAEHKPSERRSKRQILKAHVLPALGHLRLDELRQEHVDTFAATERKRGCAAKTINNRLAVLSSLVKYAVANGVIPAPNPPLRLKKPGMSAEVVAVPMDGVDKLLEAATDDRYRVAILLAAEAGLRTGEIRGLQWTDIKDGQLTVRRALDKDTGEVVPPKHNKSRIVPLSPRLAAALESLPRRGLWVVSRLDGGPLGYDGMVEVFRELYKRGGVEKPPKPIHCLRHTFGTVMAGLGTPLPVLQELMGHADIKTTMRYVHVNEAQKRSAIAAVFSRGSHVAAAAEGQEKAP